MKTTTIPSKLKAPFLTIGGQPVKKGTPYIIVYAGPLTKLPQIAGNQNFFR